MWDAIWNALLSGDYITALFQTVLAVIATIVNVILYPFSIIIEQYLPDLSTALASIADYFDIIGTYIHWTLDALAIPAAAIGLLVSYYVFAFTVTFTVWLVKLMIGWKKALWG